MDVLTIILLLLVLANIVFSWFLYRKISEMAHHHRKVVSELNLNTKLADMFSTDVDQENIFSLARHLFHHTKKRYNLRATNHRDLINELKAKDEIEEKLRDALVDFFENLMLISYKKESLSEQEKAELKKKIKMIVTHLQTK